MQASPCLQASHATLPPMLYHFLSDSYFVVNFLTMNFDQDDLDTSQATFKQNLTAAVGLSLCTLSDNWEKRRDFQEEYENMEVIMPSIQSDH